MSPRKLFSFRKGGFRIGKSGIRFSPGSMRIGGKVGVNISKSGISSSYRGKGWSFNTRRGVRRAGCATLCVLVIAPVVFWFVWLF